MSDLIHIDSKQTSAPRSQASAENASRRFSRALVLSEIERDMALLELIYRFKEGDGRAVVAGKPEAVVMAFGRYEALRDLHEAFSET